MTQRKEPVLVDGLELWRCSKCGVPKLPGAFSKDARTLSGLRSYCRTCAKPIKDSWYERNAVHVREYDAERRNAPGFIRGPRTLAQRKANNANCRRYYRENRDRFRAKEAVHNALLNGALVRPGCCEMCEKKKPTEGHHDSYDRDRWLVVTWLCVRCHRWTHARRREQR